jgi:hypothetical protein
LFREKWKWAGLRTTKSKRNGGKAGQGFYQVPPHQGDTFTRLPPLRLPPCAPSVLPSRLSFFDARCERFELVEPAQVPGLQFIENVG